MLNAGEPLCLAILVLPGGGFRAVAKRAGHDLRIGRAEWADLTIADPAKHLSRLHATITLLEGRLVLEVHGQNGVRILSGAVDPGERAPLPDGTTPLAMGDALLIVVVDSAREAPRDAAEASALARDCLRDQAVLLAEVAAEAKSMLESIVFGQSEDAALVEMDDLADEAEAWHAGKPATSEPEAAVLAPTPRPVRVGEEVTVPPWRRGAALFRVPRTMWTETAELAELRLTAQGPLTIAMKAALERSLHGRDAPTSVHDLQKVGSRMKAILFGDGRFLTVEPLSSEVQDLAGGVAAWDWRVVPVREGHTLLTLRVSMVGDLEGRELRVDAQALHTSVEITVHSFWTRPRRFVRDHWKWLLGGSGLGAIATIAGLLSQAK